MDEAKNQQQQNELKTPLDWFQWVQDFTDRLTLRRVFTILLAGMMISVLAVLYENRAQFFRTAVLSLTDTPTDKGWDVGAESQRELQALVDTSPIINFVLVTEVDLAKNRRSPKFWHLESPDEKLIREKAKTMLPVAVFDYDQKNTEQMISIINNEFVCSKYTDTLYQRIFPSLGKQLPIICRLAIPPFYGRFVGILTVGLNSNPTKEELDSIRLEISRLAVNIYLRDILKKSKPSS